MFYIRKKVDSERYMVMDTKDGVCELTSREDIESYVKQGIYIAGVSFNKDTSTLEISECSGMPLHELYMKSVVREVNVGFRKKAFSTDSEIMGYLFEVFKSRYDNIDERLEDFKNLTSFYFVYYCVSEICTENGVLFEPLEHDIDERYDLIYKDDFTRIKVVIDKSRRGRHFLFRI